MALEKIAWYSFPYNHLINIQLLKNVDNTDTLKPLYFGMVSLIPGVKDNNNRTYDYSQAIHVKYNLHELEGLSFALKQYAIGNVQNLGYVKFTNSNNTSKIVSLLVGIEKQTVKGEEISHRAIAFNVASNGNGKRVQLTCDNAHAMAETLHQLYLVGCQHEFSREVNTDSYDNRKSGNTSNSAGGNKNTSFGNSSFSDNSNSNNDDDNASFLGGQFGGGGNFGGGNPFS